MKTRLSVLMVSILFFSLCVYAQGQDKVKSENSANPKEEAKAQTDQENEKGEVDRVLDDLNNRNEIVLGRCLEGAACEPVKGRIVDGQVLKGEVTDGKLVENPQPVYPAVAKAARASGAVRVLLIVDEEGMVIAAQPESGHPLLRVAALKAARAARFTPTRLDGKPVKVSGVITYKFVLQ